MDPAIEFIYLVIDSFFSKRLWELPRDTAQLFLSPRVFSDMLLLTDFNTVMQLKKSPVLPEWPSDVLIKSLLKHRSRSSYNLVHLILLLKHETGLKEGQLNAP